ncbi:hypothetical protein [Absidia glauca]|uniref:Farnesyl pyrophosphate synthase n=1 Tax=Absidia glauca TaxID=4829 RepID=A0A168L928_ABSGL|nr:hypothetical protein [Absidia glauca]
MTTVKLHKEESRKAFLDIYPSLVEEILSELRKYNMPADAYEWTRESLLYNVPGGKLNRGLSVVDTIRSLKGDAVTDDDIFKASILGWLLEFFQAVSLVSDDIMDGSITRRGQPCWYRKENVGMVAINDSFILQSCVYILLKKYFKATDYYVDMIELFHEVAFQTELGQLCDLITAPEDNVDLDKFSVEKHRFIVIYKTAYYSFYLPVALALHMTGVKNEAAYTEARNILIPLGEYFQIQDDYLDCYGDPDVIGKIGTDIQVNKCSWLINQALAKANPEQRKVLDDNYGKKDAGAEAKVKALYAELKIEDTYKAYEEKSFQELTSQISKIDESTGVKKAVLTEFMDKIYRRTK